MRAHTPLWRHRARFSRSTSRWCEAVSRRSARRRGPERCTAPTSTACASYVQHACGCGNPNREPPTYNRKSLGILLMHLYNQRTKLEQIARQTSQIKTCIDRERKSGTRKREGRGKETRGKDARKSAWTGAPAGPMLARPLALRRGTGPAPLAPPQAGPSATAEADAAAHLCEPAREASLRRRPGW